MLGIQIARHEDGKTAAKAGRQINRLDFHRFTGQHALDSSGVQVLSVLDGYRLVIYTAKDQYSCSASFS